MRIIVLGGNGMVGHKMYQILSREFEEVFITIRSLDNLEKKKIIWKK